MELRGDLDTSAFVDYVLTDVSEQGAAGEDITNRKLQEYNCILGG